MKILIVSGGKPPSKELLINSISGKDIIIGVDKGCDTLAKYNIIPDYIIGDFDSALESNIDFLEKEGAVKLKFKKEKDFTDTECAFNLAVEKSAKEIVLLGVTGSRYDHVLSNIGILYKALKLGIYAEILDDNNKIFITNKSLELKGNPGQIVSFHAYSEEVTNLSIIGAKYELQNYRLELGDGLNTSNEFVESKITVEFTKGILIVLYTND